MCKISQKKISYKNFLVTLNFKALVPMTLTVNGYIFMPWHDKTLFKLGTSLVLIPNLKFKYWMLSSIYVAVCTRQGPSISLQMSLVMLWDMTVICQGQFSMAYLSSLGKLFFFFLKKGKKKRHPFGCQIWFEIAIFYYIWFIGPLLYWMVLAAYICRL